MLALSDDGWTHSVVVPAVQLDSESEFEGDLASDSDSQSNVGCAVDNVAAGDELGCSRSFVMHRFGSIVPSRAHHTGPKLLPPHSSHSVPNALHKESRCGGDIGEWWPHDMPSFAVVVGRAWGVVDRDVGIPISRDAD